MNEPILTKAPPHGLDYKPITLEMLITLGESAQKVADAIGYPVYLVGSAMHKEIPRDIDISVIIPLDKYEEMFGKLPTEQKYYSGYLGRVFYKSWEYTQYLHFCVDYHLDIKVCPNTWWVEKPKLLLAKPKGDDILSEPILSKARRYDEVRIEAMAGLYYLAEKFSVEITVGQPDPAKFAVTICVEGTSENRANFIRAVENLKPVYLPVNYIGVDENGNETLPPVKPV